MPNHVTTKLTIEGPPEAIREFAQLHIIYTPTHMGTNFLGQPMEIEGSTDFDFNTVVPRPSILDGIVSGSETYLAIEAITGKTPHELTGKGWDFAMFNTPEHKARRQEQMDKLTVEQLEKGMKALQAVEETGHTDWYGWCCENWGTKWNSYEFELIEQAQDKLVIRFQTAWSVPMPILQKVLDLHPRVTLLALSFDEMANFASIVSTLPNRQAHYLEVATDKEMYRKVYDEEPQWEEEEAE